MSNEISNTLSPLQNQRVNVKAGGLSRGHKPLQQPEAVTEPMCECIGRRPFTRLARVKRPKEATRGQKSILKTTTSKRLHNPPTHLKPVKCSDIASRCHQRPNRRQQKPNAAQAALCLWPRALARTNHETRTHQATPKLRKSNYVPKIKNNQITQRRTSGTLSLAPSFSSD